MTFDLLSASSSWQIYTHTNIIIFVAAFITTNSSVLKICRGFLKICNTSIYVHFWIFVPWTKHFLSTSWLKSYHKIIKGWYPQFGHLTQPTDGVRGHSEAQSFMFIILGKYEYETPKLNSTFPLTLLPVTSHTENNHIIAWLWFIKFSP